MAAKVCPECNDYGLIPVDGTLVQCPCQTSIQWAAETLPMGEKLKMELLRGTCRDDETVNELYTKAGE